MCGRRDNCPLGEGGSSGKTNEVEVVNVFPKEKGKNRALNFRGGVCNVTKKKKAGEKQGNQGSDNRKQTTAHGDRAREKKEESQPLNNGGVGKVRKVKIDTFSSGTEKKKPEKKNRKRRPPGQGH